VSDHIHADPNDVEKLASALKKYEEEVLAASRKALQAIERANWQDRQKQQFASSYRDFHKKTENFVRGRVRDFVKSLNSLAYDLERAKRHRF
jgi:uncharacterized protein YukE